MPPIIREEDNDIERLGRGRDSEKKKTEKTKHGEKQTRGNGLAFRGFEVVHNVTLQMFL
jgi:hypothetical protein